MQNYYQISISNADIIPTLAVDLLSAQYPEIEGYEVTDDYLIAYLPEAAMSEGLITKVGQSLGIDATLIKSEPLPYKNYNAEWESNFQPIVIHDFVAIRAEFHDEDFDCDHTITIRPKMAFGTGHHATTYMMLDTMRTLDFKEKSVFDFGAGTGILSVMASMLGAKSIVANDIQKEAMDNIREHYLINPCQASITILHGGLSVVHPQKFDIILANINTVVLSECASNLRKLIAEDGTVLLSGILKEKEERIKVLYEDSGFGVQERKQRGDWVCMRLSPIIND